LGVGHTQLWFTLSTVRGTPEGARVKAGAAELRPVAACGMRHAAGWWAVRRIRISAEFNGIAWSRWGSVACNQRIAPTSERPKSEAVSDGFRRFSSPRRSVPRVWRARMSRRGRACPEQSHPRQRAAFCAPRAVRAVKTIDGSRWRGREGNQSIGSKPIDLCARNQWNRSRCAGPNRRTAGGAG
jgi:hypothetical protein